jgi:type I restriction enzyme S subunit
MNFLPSKNKSLPSNLVERVHLEVREGDILLTRAGPSNRVGICALVKKTPSKLMLSDKIIRFHPINTPGGFIELFIGGEFFQGFIKNFKTGMAESQVNISQANLKKVLIVLPPLQEQKEIVKKVEKLFAIFDQLEEQITSSQTNADQLMQSVLKEAFSQDEKVA